MKHYFLGMLAAFALLPPAVNANGLKTGKLPMCGPVDAAFEQLRAGLNQRPAWHGERQDRAGLRSGRLELTVGRNGEWSLFFRFVDPDGRQRICLVSRGVGSQALFGRPM